MFYLLFEPASNLTDLQQSKHLLTMRVAEFFKKAYNPINFKNHVSPHELLQAIGTKSAKKFGIGKKCDPVQFFAWLINALHLEMKDQNGRCISL